MPDKFSMLKKKGSDHYKTKGVEPIDLIKSGGILRDFAIGCIIKYAFRNRSEVQRPISISDMEKIIHYAEMLKVLAEESNEDTDNK